MTLLLRSVDAPADAAPVTVAHVDDDVVIYATSPLRLNREHAEALARYVAPHLYEATIGTRPDDAEPGVLLGEGDPAAG